jgi:dihydroneopterin aldolase
LDTIFIEQIEFYGYHGASDEEQNVGHRYAVDVELRYDTALAGQTDDLNDTVNYSRVARRVVSVGINEQFRLLEALAARLANVILTEFPIDSVRLRVRKIRPPMNVIAVAVGVEIERSREALEGDTEAGGE